MSIREADVSILRKILNELKGKGIYELGLVGLGEPLLDRKLSDHIKMIDEYARDFERISINTNAVALSQDKAELICKSSINHITFSLNALNEDEYENLMGRNCFERVINNIRTFLKIRDEQKRTDLMVNVQIFDTENNDKDELENLFGLKGQIYFYSFVRSLYAKPNLEKNKFGLQPALAEPKKRHPCWSIFSRIYIDVNGFLYPCTIGNDCYREHSTLAVGNIREESIMNLFNGEKMAFARGRGIRGEAPFSECLNCNVWSLLPNNFRWHPKERIWVLKDTKTRFESQDTWSRESIDDWG